MPEDHEVPVSAAASRRRVFGEVDAAAEAFEQLPFILVVTEGP